ncbi:MAG: hypothetical protein ABIT37_15275 [Luteolibacter sp.]
MSDEPPVPEPTPEIPRRPLWSCLAVPPVLTVLANGLIALGGKSGQGLSLAVPVVMFFVIIGLTQHFHGIISKRYQGPSLLFLNFAYFFGQIIVCLTLWFGSCVLLFAAPNLH